METAENIKQAIDNAKAAAMRALGNWIVEVDEQIETMTLKVIVVFTADPKDMENAACDAPWAEFGGNEIVAELEAAGFHQDDAWTYVFNRRTYGGGSVRQYETGVVYTMDLS